VPDGLEEGEHPALVSLHPLGGNRSGWAGETDLAEFAAREGVILVIPQGLWGTWNAGECCGPSAGFGVDDIGFLDQILTDTATRSDVDPDQVYLSGLSNGALMVLDYLCKGSFEPAGAAAVAVIPWDMGGCEGRVPLLVSVGTADEVFPFEGGTTWMGFLASGRSSVSWAQSIEELSTAWGCADIADVETFSAWSSPLDPLTEWTRTTYGGCNAPLTTVTVEGVPHTWLWGGNWSHTLEVFSAFGLSPEPGVEPTD
jgi:polyhydroxybutyrate depolymerase